MGENTARGVLYQTLSAKAAAKVRCIRGHPLFGENLIRDPRGGRRCKTCQRMKADEWRIANRERVNEMQRRRRAGEALSL